MKISIEEIPQGEEEEIIIKCHEMNDEIMALLHRLKVSKEQLTGMQGDEIYRLSLKDIYYFDTVDQKSFLYCENQVYETKLKLYEFEELTAGTQFFRASKSTVINAMKISHIKPSFSGRFEAHMDNGEKLLVSRGYVPQLKKILGL
ncbi:MAG: LytTR family transcriptional regulator DNA-binding domain-containing protein [Lachnospiraceae bacterium]|nr:LytTR family transcriptional regulator DNA-binding domain-containing protein [Lachnospiraceae bacterium]